MSEPPTCRSTQLVAFHAAVMRTYGEAGWTSVVENLGADARADLLPGGLLRGAGWVAEKHMMELASAIHEGPCDGDDGSYRRLLAVTIDQGFGRIRKLFVQLASPAMLLTRAPELWKHDHSHGSLKLEHEEGMAIITIEHPVLVSTRLGALTAAEMFRYIVTLTRVQSVTEQHVQRRANVLDITIHWAH